MHWTRRNTAPIPGTVRNFKNFCLLPKHYTDERGVEQYFWLETVHMYQEYNGLRWINTKIVRYTGTP